MPYTVHQQITVQQLKVNNISNSSILQIGSSGSMEGYSVVGADSTSSTNGEQQAAASPNSFAGKGKKSKGMPTNMPFHAASYGYGAMNIDTDWNTSVHEAEDEPFTSNFVDPIFVPLPLPIWEGW